MSANEERPQGWVLGLLLYNVHTYKKEIIKLLLIYSTSSCHQSDRSIILFEQLYKFIWEFPSVFKWSDKVLSLFHNTI